MSDWCPENDGAYRAEMAAMYHTQNQKSVEELEAENKRLRPEVAHANDIADVAIERARELEAKLAKAVEALKWQASQPEAHPFMAQHASTTIAELTEGE